MRPDGITGSNTSHSNSQCGAKYLTAPLNEPLCWLLCDPQKKIPSPDFTQTSAVTRNSNKLLYVSRLFCSSSYTLHTMTPTARSFVRARQTWTKSLCEGVENPPPSPPKLGGVTEWGVTLNKHTHNVICCLNHRNQVQRWRFQLVPPSITRVPWPPKHVQQHSTCVQHLTCLSLG